MSTESEPIGIYAYMAIMVDQTAGIAWSKLGLQPDPISGKMAPNIPEAKVAIDLIADIVKHLEPELDDADRRQVQSLLRDLRINYVDKQKEIAP